MNETENILKKVGDAFKATFDVDPQLVSLDTSPSDIPAWDSVGHLSLAVNLEECFGINLDVDELMEMENVRQIVRVISAKASKKV